MQMASSSYCSSILHPTERSTQLNNFDLNTFVSTFLFKIRVDFILKQKGELQGDWLLLSK